MCNRVISLQEQALDVVSRTMPWLMRLHAKSLELLESLRQWTFPHLALVEIGVDELLIVGIDDGRAVGCTENVVHAS